MNDRKMGKGTQSIMLWKREKALRILFILGSVLATVKVIFVDYTLDEEYQVVMAYRRLTGDTLFGTMWEPHQTSAFVCTWLMRFFLLVTGGTTGVVLFLRFVTTGIQLGLAWWFANILEAFIRKEYAFCLGCCYFNMIPKIIQIPEFSNLQLWFFTVLVLALMQYYLRLDDVMEVRSKKRLFWSGRGNGFGKGWLVLAGVGMALMVLAYPSSLLLFPFFLIMVFYQSGSGRWEQDGKKFLWRRALADAAIFSGTCAICAIFWLCAVLSEISWQEFWRNIPYILEFDLTHDVSISAEYRGIVIARGLKSLLVPLIASLVLGTLMWLPQGWRMQAQGDERKGTVTILAVFWVLSAELVQLFYWVILRRGYEEPQLPVLMLYLAAAIVWCATKKGGEKRSYLLRMGIWGGLLTILAVVYMSDLDAWYAIPHGLLGALFAAVVVLLALERQLGEGSGRWALLLVVSLALCAVLGKGFTLRAGTTDTNTVLGIRGVVRKGPAAGIFTNYMQAYITNCTYEDFQDFVKEGENCLIVTNMVGTAGTSPYLFRNLSVSHFSIVDPTSYDERLLTYWRLYPEKVPDVIVVDCWYGGLMEDEDSWIMRYIEQEFGYCTAEDGRYVRFYRKTAL